MAFQHFYSRVPARVSMYNKCDGFDTFAHSNGLTREFIERELLIVYQDKLSKTDMPFVRKGEIKPVYYQCCVKSGKLVQGCITYLPLDYTGERSAYFTHSLVFTDEEAKDLLVDTNKTIFNTKVFKTDISEFNITSPLSSPNNNYPEIDYITDLDNYRDLCHYGPEMNRYILEAVKNGTNKIDGETYSERLEAMYTLVSEYNYDDLWN